MARCSCSGSISFTGPSAESTCASTAPDGSFSSRASAGISSIPATSDTYNPTSPLCRCSITTLPSGRAGRAFRPTKGPRSIRAATRPCWLITPSSAGGARGTRETNAISVTRRTAESGSAYRLPPCRQMTARGIRSLQFEPRDDRLQLHGQVGQLLRSGGDGRRHHRLVPDGAGHLLGALGIRGGDLADLADGLHHLLGAGQLLLGGVRDGGDASGAFLGGADDLVQRKDDLGQVLAPLTELVDALPHRGHGVLAALADLLRQPADLLRGAAGRFGDLADCAAVDVAVAASAAACAVFALELMEVAIPVISALARSTSLSCSSAPLAMWSIDSLISSADAVTLPVETCISSAESATARLVFWMCRTRSRRFSCMCEMATVSSSTSSAPR